MPSSAFREGPEYIAHAGGKIDGAIYTNSREAIEQAIRLGHRFIEIDFKATIGGELYGCHSKREFIKNRNYFTASFSFSQTFTIA